MRWTVHAGRGKYHGETKEVAMLRAQRAIETCKLRGEPWGYSQSWWYPRTRWPLVLVIDRSLDEMVRAFNSTLTEGAFHWTDSSGGRSVWWWGTAEAKDYSQAIDLPETVYEGLRVFLLTREANLLNQLCLRIKDPGLGIVLPEEREALRQTSGDGQWR
jgi:hypothetical protein